MLRRLEAGMPEDLDALTPEQRRELYRRLGLKANVASSDGSITLTWFVDAELGVIRCQEEGTSRRSFSSANLPPSKGLGVTLILREGAPPETSFRALGSI